MRNDPIPDVPEPSIHPLQEELWGLLEEAGCSDDILQAADKLMEKMWLSGRDNGERLALERDRNLTLNLAPGQTITDADAFDGDAS